MLHNLNGLPAVVVLAACLVLVLLVRELTHLPLLTGEERTRRGSAKGQNCLLRRRPVLLPLKTSVMTPMVTSVARVGVGQPDWATSISR